MSNYRKIEASEYLTHDCLSGGDYGGFGYLARVNVEVLEEIAEQDDDASEHVAHCGMNDWSLRETIEFHEETPPALVIASGWHGSVTAYIHPDWDAGREVIEGLENYPVIDDEAVSEYEMNAEIEAWSSWVRGDLQRDILTRFNAEEQDEVDEWLDTHEGWLSEKFIDACDKRGSYAIFETDGAPYYADMELIAGDIAQWLKIELDRTPQGSIKRAQRDGLIAPLGWDVAETTTEEDVA